MALQAPNLVLVVCGLPLPEANGRRTAKCSFDRPNDWMGAWAARVQHTGGGGLDGLVKRSDSFKDEDQIEGKWEKNG